MENYIINDFYFTCYIDNDFDFYLYNITFLLTN